MSSNHNSDDVFRSALEGVKPLKNERVAPFRPKRKASPEQRKLDEQNVVDNLLSEFNFDDMESGDELYYAQPNVQKSTLKKLRRGDFVVEEEMDLHGLTASEAREQLVDFIDYALDRGFRCVRIIHGKGNRSPNRRPVLKAKVDRWLCQWDEVLAYCSARPQDGGTGAIYVLLRKKN